LTTAVDTNVLVDVFRNDPAFCKASSEALRRCLREGRLAVSDVVWAELSALFESEDALRGVMNTLGIDYLPTERQAASLAGSMWRRYRDGGGTRDRVIADFLVAAHAQAQCDRLLTRDRGFYRAHFAGLNVLDPTET
jgi:predicted nucleic acid-binding protein